MRLKYYGYGLSLMLFISALACSSDSDGDNNENSANNTNNTNNANSINNFPDTCTSAYQYDDWNVSSDRALIKACSPYIVDDSIEVVEGAELTIQAGTVIEFQGGEWLRVRDGQLTAIGTEADPIVFTSDQDNPTPGSWLGLRFDNDVENDTRLEHVRIEFAGEESFSQKACATFAGTRKAITMRNITFADCLKGGLYSDSDAFVELAALTFEDIDGFGFSFVPDSIGTVTEAFVYNNTPYNQVNDETLNNSGTWVAQPVPYLVANSLDVRGENDPILTLEAGVTIQFEAGEWLRVGSSDDGGLITNGTETNPVIIESAADNATAGQWLGVFFSDNLLSETSLDHTIIRHGGEDSFGSGGCLSITDESTTRVAITNTTFEDCLQSGIYAREASFGFQDFQSNTFRNMDFAMNLPPNAYGTIPAAQTYDTVPANRMAGEAVSETATWVNQGIPFRVFDSVDVRGDASPVLTIEPGVELLFESGEWLRIGSSESGGINAVGTSAEPIIFASQEAAPTPGSWIGLYFGSDTAGGSLLENVEVRDAGEDSFNGKGAITMYDIGTSLTIRDVLFANNAQNDIYCDADSMPTIENVGGASMLCPDN